MTRRLIVPVYFGQALKKTLDYREAGESTIVSAHKALDDCGVSRDWTVPLIATLDSSPAIAVAWADRQYINALDRAAGRIEA